MRLSLGQQRTLRRAFSGRFGPGARLWLCGSRVDDARRGGDVDLLVQTPLADADALVDARLAFLAALHAQPLPTHRVALAAWEAAREAATRLAPAA